MECNDEFIARWSARFSAERLAGLYSRHRGQPARTLTPKLEARILETTRRAPADGSTHWSSRKLGKVLGISHMMVARVWAKHGLKPQRLDYLNEGLALERQYRFLEAEGTLQLRTDRRHHLPYGLAGGRPGTPSRNVLNPGPESRELPAKCTLTVRHGDVYRHELAGAGGWGDPFERDPEHVLRDVMEEKISVPYARREYGVAIDERTWTIVPEETMRLRAAAGARG